MPASSLAILMPVYNEAPTLERAIDRIRAEAPPFGLERTIIAVDDGSNDASGELLRELAERYSDVTALKHPANLGKGAAIATALAHADTDIMLIHDADLEYDPRDHHQLLEPIVSGRADAVIGSRFRGGTTHRVLYYWHSIANRIVTTLSNAMTNLNLSDIECCSKAMTREVAERLVIQERGFGVEPELVAKIARLRLEGGRRPRVYEAPVSYAGRTYEEGKKIRGRDGLEAIWCILRYALGPHTAPTNARAEAQKNQENREDEP